MTKLVFMQEAVQTKMTSCIVRLIARPTSQTIDLKRLNSDLSLGGETLSGAS